MALVYFNVESVTTEELRELIKFAEIQDTTDAFKNTTMHINGDDAELDLEFTEDGNIIVL